MILPQLVAGVATSCCMPPMCITGVGGLTDRLEIELSFPVELSHPAAVRTARASTAREDEMRRRRGTTGENFGIETIPRSEMKVVNELRSRGARVGTTLRKGAQRNCNKTATTLADVQPSTRLRTERLPKHSRRRSQTKRCDN